MDQYGKRYIESDHFYKYYHKVAESELTSSLSGFDTPELEVLEEQGLLKPVCRVAMSDGVE